MISVVRFGPIDDDGVHDARRTWGLVGWSPVGESIVVVDRTEEDALAKLITLAEGEPVRCEPSLAAIAKRLGLPSSAAPPAAYELCALVALEVLSGVTMESDAGFLILEACAKFLAKKPWRRWPNLGGLGLIADFGAMYGRGVSEPRGLPVASAYASPERLRDSDDGDPTKADVFSVGVVLFEMLTGRRPFEELELEHGARRAGEPPKGHAECPADFESVLDALLVAPGSMKEVDARAILDRLA